MPKTIPPCKRAKQFSLLATKAGWKVEYCDLAFPGDQCDCTPKVSVDAVFEGLRLFVCFAFIDSEEDWNLLNCYVEPADLSKYPSQLRSRYPIIALSYREAVALLHPPDRAWRQYREWCREA